MILKRLIHKITIAKTLMKFSRRQFDRKDSLLPPRQFLILQVKAHLLMGCSLTLY